jgi:hypothetical protein
MILLGGLLVAVPFLVVPLQNSLPALIVFFACVGRLQRDGVMYLLALLSLVVTLVHVRPGHLGPLLRRRAVVDVVAGILKA